MGGRFEHDVFIGYAGPNEKLVREHVVGPLRAAGYSVHTYEDFAAGSRVMRQIKDGIQKSSKFLVIYTEECAKSPYVQYEIETALKCNLDEKTDSVICITYGGIGRPGVLEEFVCPCARDEKQLDEEIQKLVQQWRRDPVPPVCLSHGGSALAVGAHWDDIPLGCLGFLIKLATLYGYQVDLLVLCTKYGPQYYGVLQTGLDATAYRFYDQVAGECKFTLLDYPATQRNAKTHFSLQLWLKDHMLHKGKMDRHLCDRKLSEEEFTIGGLLEAVIQRAGELRQRPYNLILCPPTDDMNEDHAVVGRAVFSQFRDPEHTVLEYPIKRYTDRLFMPNLCIGLDDDVGTPPTPCSVADRKIQVVKDVCRVTDEIRGSERLFAEDALRARMRMSAIDYAKDRAMQYAEVFRGRLEL